MDFKLLLINVRLFFIDRAWNAWTMVMWIWPLNVRKKKQVDSRIWMWVDRKIQILGRDIKKSLFFSFLHFNKQAQASKLTISLLLLCISSGCILWPATHRPLAGYHSSRRWAVGHCSSRPTINASHHNRPVATSNAQVFLGCFGVHVDVNPNTVPCGLFPPSVHNRGATWLGLDLILNWILLINGLNLN